MTADSPVFYTIFVHDVMYNIYAGSEMHVFESPNGVNHVSYMTEIKSYYPKHQQNIQPPPAFTFVREPLSHFASGLAEYHFRCSPKKNVTRQSIQQVREQEDSSGAVHD